MESALRKSDDRYLQLLSNIPAALYQFELTADGIQRMNYLSPRFSEMFELLDAAVLQNISVLFDRIVPEDREEFYRSIQTSATSGQNWQWEGRMFMPIENTIKWLRGDSTPKYAPNGSIVWDGMMIDITAQRNALEERNRAQAELATSQQKYYNLIQSINGVVWEYDLVTDRFSFVSDRAGSL